MLRRYNLVRAFLIAGVILGFGGGIFSIAHHRHHGYHGRCDQTPPPAPAPAPEPR